MPSKRQPKAKKAVGPSYEGYKGYDFSEADFKEIAEALCRQGEGYQRKIWRVKYWSSKIWLASRDYFANLDIERTRSRSSEFRQNLLSCLKWLHHSKDELLNIPNPLNQLLSQFGMFDQRTTDMLTQLDHDLLPLFAKIDRLSSAIRRFIKAYEEILGSIQLEDISRLSVGIKEIDKHIKIDKGGRTNWRKSLQRYICDLAAIYEEMNGKPVKEPTYAGKKRFYAGHGDFFYFVIACLKTIGDPISESALASQMKIALKTRKQ
jgi:hypothetical protein